MNLRGIISIDFLFAFVIIILLTFFLITLSFSLSMMEVTQYMTYSSAREYFISHPTLSQQEGAAEEKFDQLQKHFLPSALRGWFVIQKKPGYNLVNPHDLSDAQRKGRNLFVGVQATFKSNLLNLPSFLGESVSNFTLDLGSYLGREVSQEECKKFFRGSHKNSIQGMFQNIPMSLPPTCPSGIACYEC